MPDTETGNDREPQPPTQRDPADPKIPEKDPPSRRRGPIEEPGDNPDRDLPDDSPVQAPTDPDIEKQGEINFN